MELSAKLTQRGFPEDVIVRVLDRLAGVGLVDDAAFAEQWVESRRIHAGKGRRALLVELHNKGVSDDLIDAALAGVDAGAERVRAEQLVQARLRRENLDTDRMKLTRRLVAMLARRGYEQAMAYDVVRVQLDLEADRRRI